MTILFDTANQADVMTDFYFGMELRYRGGMLLTGLTDDLSITQTAFPGAKLPAYLSHILGSNLGVTTDGMNLSVSSPTNLDLITNQNLTWKAYIESLPPGCSQTPVSSTKSDGSYLKSRNPFYAMKSVTKNITQCTSLVEDLSQLDVDVKTDNMPTVMYVMPTLEHSAGGYVYLQGGGGSYNLVKPQVGSPAGTVMGASGWLRKFLNKKLDDPYYANTSFYITFVQSRIKSKFNPNPLFDAIIGAGVTGLSPNISTPFTPATWLATLEKALNLGNLGRADATAQVFPLHWDLDAEQQLVKNSCPRVQIQTPQATSVDVWPVVPSSAATSSSASKTATSSSFGANAAVSSTSTGASGSISTSTVSSNIKTSGSRETWSRAHVYIVSFLASYLLVLPSLTI